MNTKTNHQVIPALPNVKETSVILDFIASKCANLELMKKFMEFAASACYRDGENTQFDFYTMIMEGQHSTTGLATIGYAIRFVYKRDTHEELRFFPVENGTIYEMINIHFPNANKFH